MIRTRRPKSEKPLVPLAVKISGDIKDVLLEMSVKADRSVSYILEGLLTSHPELSPKLKKLRQPLKLAA